MFFSKHKIATILISLTVVVFILMGVSAALTNSEQKLTGANFVGILFSPVQNFFSSIGNSVSGFFGYIADMQSLSSKNGEMQQYIYELEQKNRDFESYKQENERLRHLLNLTNEYDSASVVSAEIVAKEPNNWFNMFTINQGSKDGITPNSVVISVNKGLVGYVSYVDINHSTVTSIIDPTSAVGAVFSRTRNFAIVESDLSLGNQGLCKATYVAKTTGLSLGDVVETSGLGPIFPKGILIGTILNIQTDPTGVNNKITIQPAVDFSSITEVAVLIAAK